jgi:RimJ/RimL family protein N-acetyltransferase
VKVFETERLVLRPSNPEDAQFIRQLMNTPKWLEFVGDRKIYSDKDAEIYIREKMLPQMERLGYGNYIMMLKSNGIKVGVCGLYDRDGLEGVDLGFALLEEFEKKGYAFEGAQKVLEIAFAEFGLNEVKAITSQQHLASQKLLIKLGLKNIGTTTLPGDDEELFLFSISKEAMLP